MCTGFIRGTKGGTRSTRALVGLVRQPRNWSREAPEPHFLPAGPEDERSKHPGLLQRDDARSSVYRLPRPANDNDVEWVIIAMLNGEGCRIKCKRLQQLIRKMGITALGPKPRAS